MNTFLKVSKMRLLIVAILITLATGLVRHEPWGTGFTTWYGVGFPLYYYTFEIGTDVQVMELGGTIKPHIDDFAWKLSLIYSSSGLIVDIGFWFFLLLFIRSLIVNKFSKKNISIIGISLIVLSCLYWFKWRPEMKVKKCHKLSNDYYQKVLNDADPYGKGVKLSDQVYVTMSKISEDCYKKEGLR